MFDVSNKYPQTYNNDAQESQRILVHLLFISCAIALWPLGYV